jgi:hypothetical protein
MMKKDIVSKGQRLAYAMRGMMVVTLICVLAILSMAIAGVFFTKRVYNQLIVEVEPSNLRSRIQQILPKEFLAEIIEEAINGYLSSSFSFEHSESTSEYDRLLSAVQTKCRALDYCYKSRNVSMCTSYIISAENWCTQYI